jgi:hypothetical protein
MEIRAMLSLPQLNGSRIETPNIPNYRCAFEAFGFHVIRSTPTTLLMERHYPDDCRFADAQKYRAKMPPEFAAQVQRSFKIVK